jgi:hypothetical protein
MALLYALMLILPPLPPEGIAGAEILGAEGAAWGRGALLLAPELIFGPPPPMREIELIICVLRKA